MSSMSKKDEDLLFAPDLHAATMRKGRRIAYTLTFTAFMFFVIFGTWASMAELDEVTRGEGTFIPAQKTQIIQNLEGGIITELMVQEGDIVEKGDILLRIDNSQATSNVKDSNEQLKILSATVKRLTAELNDTPLEYTEAEIENAPDQVADQTSLFNARKLQQDAQIKVLENQSRQRRQEVAEVRSRIGQLRNSLALAREERNITKPLVDKGISPRLELIRIDRQVADLEGEIKTLRTSLPRLEGATLEAKQRINEMVLTTKAEVSDELNRSRAEMKSLSERVAAGVDTVQRTDIRSPVRGTIKELKRNTVGGVIRPG
uniref:HlyD family type I secretion periplasmic adaptor subunit n=1 Tax=uncultured Kiloniella sp. TaxID=1133091 RepID=UPI002625672E